ncbi:MAG: DUF3842 family protein [Sporolactobacillus sp.]
MKIAVFDGQGAGLGQTVIRALCQSLPQSCTIIALGTNTYATSKMVRAGASMGISGEKGFISFCRQPLVDGLIAPISIIEPGSLRGELTAAMVHAFTDLRCRKFLIPLQHPRVFLPGVNELPIKTSIEEIVRQILAETISHG